MTKEVVESKRVKATLEGLYGFTTHSLDTASLTVCHKLNPFCFTSSGSSTFVAASMASSFTVFDASGSALSDLSEVVDETGPSALRRLARGASMSTPSGAISLASRLDMTETMAIVGYTCSANSKISRKRKEWVFNGQRLLYSFRCCGPWRFAFPLLVPYLSDHVTQTRPCLRSDNPRVKELEDSEV